MLKEIIKIQFLNLWFSRVNNHKKRFNFLIAFIPLIAFLYMSCLYSYMFMSSLKGHESTILYLMAFISFSLICMLSIEQAQGHLFNFKDYDLLLSLPIKKQEIMIGKMVSFIIIQVIYMGFLFVPALLIYGVKTSVGLSYYLFAFIGFVPFVLIPIVISSGLGMFIKKLSGKSRYKNIFNNLIMIVMVFMIILGSQYFSRMSINHADINILYTMIENLRIYAPSIYYYVDAILNSNVLSLLVSLLLNIGIFILFIYISAKYFIILNQDNHESFHVKNYQLTRLKISSVRWALFKKEFLRFAKNFMYVFNMAFGEFLLLGGSVYLLLNKEMIENLLGDFYLLFRNETLGLVVGCILMISAISNTAGVSVSLEGKQLWITKSLPVKTIDILMSKVLVNVAVIFVPTAISIFILKFALDLSILEFILCLIFTLEIGFIVGLYGISVNLNFPKLDYDREIIVIKQSASSFIVVMSGISISMLAGFFIIQSLMKYSATLVVFCIVLVCGVIIFFLYLYLVKVGVRKFEQLQ